MHVLRDGFGYHVSGDATFPVNAGELCAKGFTAAQTLEHPDRLRTPLVRVDGKLREATWDEALARAAAGFDRIRAARGANAVGVFGSGALTNEKAYALGKFARLALGTSNFDYNGRFCMSSAAAAQNRSFGIDRGLPFPIARLAQTDCLMLAGGNVLDTMPPIRRYITAQRERGTLIVIDPRRTELAAMATLHLQPAPGTDVVVANAILHVLIAERRLHESYIAERTSGFESLRRVVEREFPERAERHCGVPADDLRRAARLLADAASAIILTGRGIEQHFNGTEATHAFINIALALGLAGSPRGGFGTLTGQGNGQGGREHGQKSDQLPGYRSNSSAIDRAALAEFWGVLPDVLPKPGKSAYELLAAVGSEVSALLVMGSNPVVSAPNASHIASTLASADHLVVCDFFLSETARLAHVVLPVLQWAEEDGTMTNLEGRVLLRERCVEPPLGPRSDLTILRDLAARLGAERFFPSDAPPAVFDELRAVTVGGRANYFGITYDRLRDGEALYWPCPTTDHPGTPSLFEDTFATEDGRAKFFAVEMQLADETPDADYPWYFTTGRHRDQYLSGTQTRRVATLAAAVPEPLAEMHPQLAERCGIQNGSSVRIASRRGAVVLRAKVTEDIRPDTIFAAFHWGGALCVNVLTSDQLDPISRMPEFKMCAVRLDPVHQKSSSGGLAL